MTLDTMDTDMCGHGRLRNREQCETCDLREARAEVQRLNEDGKNTHALYREALAEVKRLRELVAGCSRCSKAWYAAKETARD